MPCPQSRAFQERRRHSPRRLSESLSVASFAGGHTSPAIFYRTFKADWQSELDSFLDIPAQRLRDKESRFLIAKRFVSISRSRIRSSRERGISSAAKWGQSQGCIRPLKPRFRAANLASGVREDRHEVLINQQNPDRVHWTLNARISD